MSLIDTLNLTNDTVSAIKETVAKATTGGLNAATGGQGIDLAPFVSLVPVDTPTYNSTPRVQVAQGSDSARWQTYANSNAEQVYAFTGVDAAGPLMKNAIQYQAAGFAVPHSARMYRWTR